MIAFDPTARHVSKVSEMVTEKDQSIDESLTESRMTAHLRRISSKYDMDLSSSESDSSIDLEETTNKVKSSKGENAAVIDLISDVDEIDEIGNTPASKLKPIVGKNESKANDGGGGSSAFDWDEIGNFDGMVNNVHKHIEKYVHVWNSNPKKIVEGTGIHVSSVLDFISHNGPEFSPDDDDSIAHLKHSAWLIL